MKRLNQSKRMNAVSGTLAIAVIVIVIIAAVAAVYFATTGSKTTTVTMTQTGSSTSTTTPSTSISTTTSTSTTTSASSSVSVTTVTASPIEIGYITSLSGIEAPGGSEGLVASQMAINEINNAGGIGGRPLQLVVLDDQSDPTVALTDATQLNTQHNVLAITGTAYGAAGLSIRGYTEKNGIPYVLPIANDPGETLPSNNWTVRVTPDSVSQGVAMAKYILDKNPSAKIAIAEAQFIPYFQQIAAGVKWYVKTSGNGSIVSDQTFPPSQTDFTTALASIKVANPDVIFDLVAADGNFFQEAINAGFNSSQVWLSADEPTELLPLGNGGSGVHTVSFYNTALANSSNGVAAFNQKIIPLLKACTQCGQTVTYDAYFAYTSMYIIANAAKDAMQSGSLTRQTFMTALKSLSYHDPLLGLTYTFDNTGASISYYFIVQINDLNVTAGTWQDSILQYIQFQPGSIPAYAISTGSA